MDRLTAEISAPTAESRERKNLGQIPDTSCKIDVLMVESFKRAQVSVVDRQYIREEIRMGEKASFFVLRAKAVPEVLLRVVEAKRLLDSGKVESVQEATEMVRISRSSFYKYKDDIFPYHENAKGKTVNMVIQLDDEPGLLSMVLKTIAEFHANILTIHQSVPVNGIASLSLSIDVFPATGNVEDMRNSIESVQGIHYAKILARE